MGCGSSKPKSKNARNTATGKRRPDIKPSMPDGGPVMVPQTYRDGEGRPIELQEFELNRDDIVRAWNYMGQYLDQKGLQMLLVTVGGAVSTVYLRTRRTTRDVDFFLATPEASECNVLRDAAKAAARIERSKGFEMGGNWFNNSTQLLMGKKLQAELTQAAVEQNVVVHNYQGPNGGGIVVYAAPWAYAFCGKLNRLCKPNYRPYDYDDAVAYLYEILKREGRRSVQTREIKEWCRNFGKDVTDVVLETV